MPNHWGRQPMGKNSRTSVFTIVIIGFIGYLLFNNFFKADQTIATTSLKNVNPQSTNDPNALSSTVSKSQIFPDGNNAMNLNSGNTTITTGYWVLFISNGTTQQLSLNTQDHAFLQELFQSDNNGIRASTVFLVDNGQIRQYIVSKETYSIISNMGSIKARRSNTSTSTTTPPTSTAPPTTTTPPATTVPPTTTLPTTAISETVTVSNPSTSGFTVALNPSLNGLTISNFSLVSTLGNSKAINSATTSDNGATYAISTSLSAGQTYTVTATFTGYTFGTAQTIVVPQ